VVFIDFDFGVLFSVAATSVNSDGNPSHLYHLGAAKPAKTATLSHGRGVVAALRRNQFEPHR